jgi:hypothetical protein
MKLRFQCQIQKGNSYLMPNQSSSHIDTKVIQHLYSSTIFPRNTYPVKVLKASLTFPMLVTCLAHTNLRDLIALALLGEWCYEVRHCDSFLISLSHAFWCQIFTSEFWSLVLALFSLVNVSDHSILPYNT